ncbi:polyhydroxybutyrate depolymerase [Stagnimonas aquatica]|uniref:Polyhydroxybutyrate depolymerase n=1 Tax=Stagnimonas aquatica TaxID=2689987 RepID=A0A3N0VK42_9GAMM|nr:PHB depolymerase family esterase [Stagnimonas aquatica]ROH93061.1 polyhydroxybutyrate depolymerase [Stagnimonas aquatica]
MSRAPSCRAALLALVLAGAPGFATAGGDSGGRRHLPVGETQRSYLIRVPTPLPSGPLPLVLMLHGGGGNADNGEQMSGFTPIAQREGFIVVYPDGSGRFEERLLSWNARHCCAYAMEHRVDDVAFIRTLIWQVARDYPVDPRRIYVTGMSNGGMMSHRLGIELSDTVAAIAPVVGTLFGDEALPHQPVSALIINGGTDRMVPPQGGALGGRFPGAWDGTPLRPAGEQGAFWARADGCEAAPEVQVQGGVQHWRYRCPQGLAVERYLIEDAGHAWPGGRAGRRRAEAPSQALNASETIWAFFKAHPKAP